MKNNKIKKTLIAASLFLAASASTLTNSAVLPVIDAATLAAVSAANGLLAGANALLVTVRRSVVGVAKEVKGVRSGQEDQIRQVDQYQEDTDKRNRLRAGLLETLRRDLDALPTVEQCVEMTDKVLSSGALQSSFSGGGGGRRPNGTPSPGSKAHAQEKIDDLPAAQYEALKRTVDAKTCAGGMDEAIQGCGRDPGKYAGGDTNMSSVKGNIAGIKDGQIVVNYSLNPEAFEASRAYAFNSSLYDAPADLKKDMIKLKANPSYISIYKPIIAKLNAAFDAFIAPAIVRQEAPAALASTISGGKWSATSPQYMKIFGSNAVFPVNPSLFELMQYYIYNDFAGTDPKDLEKLDSTQIARDINRKITLSNMVSIQQLKASETTNILLAHLLVQATTPANIQAAKSEANKIVTTK